LAGEREYKGGMMDVYLVIDEDRHQEPQVHVYSSDKPAIAHAKRIVQEKNSGEGDIEEMPTEGWLYNATYSCEGDCVRVEKKAVIDGQS
jgi:hypothetical protein